MMRSEIITCVPFNLDDMWQLPRNVRNVQGITHTISTPYPFDEEHLLIGVQRHDDDPEALVARVLRGEYTRILNDTNQFADVDNIITGGKSELWVRLLESRGSEPRGFHRRETPWNATNYLAQLVGVRSSDVGSWGQCRPVLTLETKTGQAFWNGTAELLKKSVGKFERKPILKF